MHSESHRPAAGSRRHATLPVNPPTSAWWLPGEAWQLNPAGKLAPPASLPRNPIPADLFLLAQRLTQPR